MNAQEIIDSSNFEFRAADYAIKLFKLGNKTNFHDCQEQSHAGSITTLSCMAQNQQDRSGNKNTAMEFSYSSPFMIPAGFDYDFSKNTLKKESICNFAELLVEGLKNEN